MLLKGKSKNFIIGYQTAMEDEICCCQMNEFTILPTHTEFPSCMKLHLYKLELI